jgi:hypothetical protein
VSLYPVTGHPLLSAEASKLDPAALEAQTLVAERLLGFTGTYFVGDEAIEAASANALQVSYQVAMPPEQSIIQSESRGSRSVTYRGQTTGTMSMVSAVAMAIADGLLTKDGGTSWGIAGPRR